MFGTILSGIGGLYTVYNSEEHRTYLLRAQSKLRHKKLKPLIGDYVDFEPGSKDEDGWLKTINPRKNEFIRPTVANIDKLCIVLSASVPETDLLLVDRLIIFAKMKNVDPVLIINKIDENDSRAAAILSQYAGEKVAPFAVSAKTGKGINELKQYLKGSIHAFCGQSGVGKSSLINCLYHFDQEVGDISLKIDRGKNTTRHAELMLVDESTMVLDTPGFSLLDLPLMEPESLRQWYSEYMPYEGKCRFLGCVHLYEPDCLVRDAVANGAINKERHERYKILFEDMKIRWKERYD